MKHAINLPAIGRLADPHALIEIAQAADENGWDGLFLWDNITFEDEGIPLPALDPWLLLGCVASHTQRLRLGPMVTPLPSRRVSQVARSATTLDLLSRGRVTIGFGLGGDSRNELTGFGETRDPLLRAEMLEDSLAALEVLWTSESIELHRGHIAIHGATMLPKPVQEPRIPIWHRRCVFYSGSTPRNP